MNDTQMAKADFLTAVVVIFASVCVMAVTLRFPRFAEWGGLYANPGFTPFLLLAILVGMYGYVLVRAIQRGGHRIRITGEQVAAFVRSGLVRRYALCLALFVLYYALLGRIPFFLDTSLYLFLAMLIFGAVRWWTALVIAVGTAGAVYLVFLRIFLVPLP